MRWQQGGHFKDRLHQETPEDYLDNLYLSVEVFEKLLPYTIQAYGADNLVLAALLIPTPSSTHHSPSHDRNTIAGRQEKDCRKNLRVLGV